MLLCISIRGGTRGGGWGHLQGAVHIAAARLGCKITYAVTFAIYALTHHICCEAHGQEILIIALWSSLLLERASVRY